MICDKCHRIIECEEHHLWPKLMDNPHGHSWKGNVSRVWLCVRDHTDKPYHNQGIHKEIIIPILRKYSSNPQYESEYYLWKYVPKDKKEECIDEVVKESLKWLNEVENDNPNP